MNPVIEAALISFAGGVVPALVWFFFWRTEDEEQPEPPSLLALTFIAGMLAVPIALFVEKMLYPYFSGLKLVVVWAATEEILKWGVYYFTNADNSEIDEPLDPAIYLVTAALGFAAIENAYFLHRGLADYSVSENIVNQAMRFVGSSPLHVFASASIGIMLGLAFYHGPILRFFYVAIGLCTAVSLHALFNYLIIDGTKVNMLEVYGFMWTIGVVILLLFEKLKHLKT